MFERRADPAVLVAAHGGDHGPGDGGGVVAVLALVCADRCVARGERCRDGVGDGSEVDVHADRLELARHGGGGGSRGPCPPLAQGRRRGGEAGTAQVPHLAALLVGGDVQADATRGCGAHRLPVSGRRTDRWGPVPVTQQDHPADVMVPHDGVEVRDGGPVLRADHHQLADPLLEAQRRQQPLPAAARGGCRRCRAGSRAGGRGGAGGRGRRRHRRRGGRPTAGRSLHRARRQRPERQQGHGGDDGTV